jgi:hypothetical protein
MLIKDYQIIFPDNQQIQETKVQKKAVPKRTAWENFIKIIYWALSFT